MSNVKYILLKRTKKDKIVHQEFTIVREDGTKSVDTKLIPIAKKK